MGTLTWTLNAYMDGAPPIIASSAAAPLEGFDHVQVVVDPSPAPPKTVNVQPGPADRVALFLVSSSHYGPGLKFTASDGRRDGATVALTQPQVLASGAVALLGIAPNVLKFSSNLAEAATVNIYVFRDATP
jgi:predicted secreted protein